MYVNTLPPVVYTILVFCQMKSDRLTTLIPSEPSDKEKNVTDLIEAGDIITLS